MKPYHLYILAALILNSCAKSNNFSDVPEIEFIGISKNQMVQSDVNADSLTLTLGFKDGDGDIGHEATSNVLNLTVIDNRSGQIYGNYKIPAIPEQGANNGVEGKVFLKLYSTCCVYPNIPVACVPQPGYPTNKLTFDIFMIDRALHKSNVITTDTITLLCD